MKKNYLKKTLFFSLLFSYLLSFSVTEPTKRKKIEIVKNSFSSVSDPGWSYTCKDGIEVELLSQGIKNNVPAQINIPEVDNVERLVVEIVYKGKNPGATIEIEDSNGNLYTANREVPAGGSSNVWYYRTELPATSEVKYTNTTHANKAQSMLAYVFRKKNNGIGSSGTFTAIGGYNNIETITIPINTDTGPRTVGIELPVSELTPDGRYIHIEVSASDGSYAELTERIFDFPDGQCCIKVFKLELQDVAGDVDEINIKIDTRNNQNGCQNGQSWVMGGSVKTDVHCSCVNDTTPPEPDLFSLPDLVDECSVDAPVAPTATDNCAGAITGTTTTSFPITTPGTTEITWIYTDAVGNSIKQLQNVIINDVTDPVLDIANLPDLINDCGIDTVTAPTATDNCDGPITGTTTTSFPITTQGTTVVTWTFTDAADNSISQTQNIIIDDATAPVSDANNLADLTGECSVNAPTTPTATDNCDGEITGITTTTFPITTQGTTVVTWTFTDSAGNSSIQTQNVIVNDSTAPIPDAISLSDLTSGCSVGAPTAPTASDNCDGSSQITGTTTTSFPVTAQGTTVVTWTFTDAAGNSSTQTQNIIINDVTPPTADNLEDHLILFDFNNLPEVTFSDECSDVTIEYREYQAVQSCWAEFGDNTTTNISFENVPFDENHHWEYGYVESLLNIRPKVHGRVVNNTDPTSGWIVEIYFESLTPYVQWVAGGGQTPDDALKDQREYANVDFSQPYTFEGFGAYKNGTITLSQNSEPHYIEMGPKAELGSYGAAFHIAYQGTLENGQAIGGNSNTIEMFAALDRCVNLRGLLLVREWIVTDAAGNSQVFIQRVETEE